MSTQLVYRGTETESGQSSEFERLRRFILSHRGNFTLGLVRVNNPRLRDSVINSLTNALTAEHMHLIRVDLTTQHPTTLLEAFRVDQTIQSKLQSDANTALAVVGMEHLIEAEEDESGRPPFAASLNIERDALREVLNIPLLFFLTDYAMDRLDQTAPDLFDWYSGVFIFRQVTAPLIVTAPLFRGRHSEIATSVASHKWLDMPPLKLDTIMERLDILEERRAELAKDSRSESRLRLGQVLREMGDLYIQQPEVRDRQSAISFHKHALEIFRLGGQKAEEAATLERLGEVYFGINDHKRAAKHFERALPLYRETTNRQGEANCLAGLADVYLLLNEYPKARSNYEEARTIYQQIDNWKGEANCFVSLADISRLLSEHSQAETLYSSALIIYRKIENLKGEAHCLASLGDVYRLVGKYPEAENSITTAMKTYRQIEDRLGEANCIKSMGDVFRLRSELALAHGQYEEALKLYRELGTQLNEANTLASIGNLRLIEEQYPLACNKFEEAIEIYAYIGDRYGQMYVVPRLAWSLHASGKTNSAIQVLEEGERMASSLQGQPNHVIISDYLAHLKKAHSADTPTYYGTGPLRTNYPRVKLHDPWEYNSLGNLLKAEGDYENAQMAYSNAVEAKPNEIMFHYNLFGALIALNRINEAQHVYKKISLLDPIHPYTYACSGDLSLIRGRWFQAKNDYKKALEKEFSPNLISWRFSLAAAFWGQGHSDEGWAEFNDALIHADADMRAEAINNYYRLRERYPSLTSLAEAIERLSASA